MKSLVVIARRAADRFSAEIFAPEVNYILVVGCVSFWLGLVAGCNNSPHESRVSGHVTLDGNSVGPGMIVFSPADAGGTPATGAIGKDGTYSLNTNHQEGLAAGKYKAALMVREPPDFTKDPIRPPPGKSLIPEKYEQSSTAGLEYDVQPGSNTIDIELSSG